jgi:hypothetical protein
MSDDFQSHERLTATKLNRSLRAGRCIGRARRITNSSATSGTALLPVLRLDDIPIFAGRLYEVRTTNLFLDGSIANDVGQAFILATMDGSTPTIASTTLPGAATQTVIPNTSFGEARPILTSYIPAVDETLSLLLVAARGSGSGAIVIQANGAGTVCEMKIVDLGEDPGDTGVDL